MFYDKNQLVIVTPKYSTKALVEKYKRESRKKDQKDLKNQVQELEGQESENQKKVR